jgi:hypothetical protein
VPDAVDLPVPLPPPATRGAAAELALTAVDALAALGETIEDEWTYVTALADAGRAKIRAAAGTDVAAPLAPAAGAAVAAVCAEADRIADPHRAIDWLSTLPAVVELALGSTAEASRTATAAGTAATDRPGPTPAEG